MSAILRNLAADSGDGEDAPAEGSADRWADDADDADDASVILS
ncbi:hypothetical protein ACFZB9_25450 [Kitasatospora sp. NPDC008050]